MNKLLQAAIAGAIVWFAAAPALADPAFNVDGATVAKTGSGAKSVILIPGLGGGAYVWDRVAPALAARYTVYTITLPGFDGVPAVKAPYLPVYERAIADLIAHEHLVKPTLVGHSLGGHLALKLAESQPDLIGAIVAVDALPLFPLQQPGETPQSRAASVVAFRNALTDTPLYAYAAQTRAMTAALVTSSRDVETIAVHSLRADRTAFAGAAAEMALEDLAPGLTAIAAPVLVLAAAPSEATAPQYAAVYRQLYAGTPHLDVRAIGTSKHFIMFDRPAAFQSALDAFLATNAR